MLLRHRPWLVLATTLVALASCDLNPQPVLPADRVASEPMLNGGTRAFDPEPDNGDDSGKGGKSAAGSAAVEVPVGGAPSDGAGGESTAGAGGESAAGAGGESTAGAGGVAGSTGGEGNLAGADNSGGAKP